MAGSSASHGPQCPICGRFFTPDPRQGDRQRLCGRPACRRTYKNMWQRRKYSEDLAHSRAKVRDRVRRHRWNRRGRSDPEPVALLGLSDVSEAVRRLEAAVTGLAARTHRCQTETALRAVLAQCVDQGRFFSPGITGSEEKSDVTGHVPEAGFACNGTRSRPCSRGVTGHVSSGSSSGCRVRP